MDRTTDFDRARHGGWTRASVFVIRAALLVFLLWALISANIPTQTPVAEDSAPSESNNRTVVAPESSSPPGLG